MSSNFRKEAKNIKEKLSKANFLLRSIKSVVAQLNNSTYNNNERKEEDEMIIPPQLFEIPNFKYHSLKPMKKDQKAFQINFSISLMKNLNLLLDGRPET